MNHIGMTFNRTDDVTLINCQIPMQKVFNDYYHWHDYSNN